MDTRKFTPLNDAEVAWKDAQLDFARKIVSQMSPADMWNPIRLESLDRCWTLWMARNEEEKQKINDHINAFGIAFGELLVESGIFDWIIVSDEYGTDLGVRALPERGNVSIVPADFVSKRWERKEVDFIADGYVSILEHVERTKTEWNEAGK